LIYRLISWLLLAAVGWVVFFFMFRTENDVDPDALATDTDGEGETDEAAAMELPGDPAAAQLNNRMGALPVDAADAALQGPVPPPDLDAETGKTPELPERRGAAQN
jgi:hypothetical protein